MKRVPVYFVQRLNRPLSVDGNWKKPLWDTVKAADIISYMGSIPEFQPEVKAKMMYDNDNLYVIFQVNDRFVRCLTKDINGPVWEDSCVEFFFAPDPDLPMRYFNLEINCGGTPLMHYNVIPDKEITKCDISDIKMIEIAHSLPQLIDPEIAERVTWTVEYRIPLAMLRKYSKVTHPGPGIEWKGNFYKIAENNSNPHYITWATVVNEVPNFHLPQFFGVLKF